MIDPRAACRKRKENPLFERKEKRSNSQHSNFSSTLAIRKTKNSGGHAIAPREKH
jgi:hypothetical protein